jgi:cytoskeletal protein RodZ
MTSMNNSQSIPPPHLETDPRRRARADAQKLLARRRRRISTIRKRAIAGALAAFAVAWAAIGFQLVSGNDPALSKSTKAAAVASTPAAKSKTSSSTKKSNSSTSSGSTASGSTSATPSQSVAPVTTRQS